MLIGKQWVPSEVFLTIVGGCAVVALIILTIVLWPASRSVIRGKTPSKPKSPPKRRFRKKNKDLIWLKI
jgi:hypothetical protein